LEFEVKDDNGCLVTLSVSTLEKSHSASLGAGCDLSASKVAEALSIMLEDKDLKGLMPGMDSIGTSGFTRPATSDNWRPMILAAEFSNSWRYRSPSLKHTEFKECDRMAFVSVMDVSGYLFPLQQVFYKSGYVLTLQPGYIEECSFVDRKELIASGKYTKEELHLKNYPNSSVYLSFSVHPRMDAEWARAAGTAKVPAH
jgi:hypothetical protein